MILVLFCRTLNGLSDEINLFRRCSSPLKLRYLLPFPNGLKPCSILNCFRTHSGNLGNTEGIMRSCGTGSISDKIERMISKYMHLNI